MLLLKENKEFADDYISYKSVALKLIHFQTVEADVLDKSKYPFTM